MLSMRTRVRMFKPIPTGLLTRFYAIEIAKLRSESGLELEKGIMQLELALADRGVNHNLIRPSSLSEDDRKKMFTDMRDHYSEAAKKMSSAEVEEYYVRLIANDFDFFAKVFERELDSRGIPHSSRRAIKSVQQDFAQAAAAHRRLEETLKSNGDLYRYLEQEQAREKDKNASESHRPCLRPDSEHDPMAHRNLRPQRRAYNQRWHYE